MFVWLGVPPLVPQAAVAAESHGGGEEEKEDAGRTGPAVTDPLLGQSGDIFEEVSDGRLDLGPEVVQGLEEVDVGDVEGVAGVAADEDVRHVEKEQQRAGVLVPATGPEGQEALVSQVVLGILSN